jgi:hypothetical protein
MVRNSPNSRIRLKAELDRAHQEITLLREEVRIKDVRMTQLSPHRRPYYPPVERMAILQLKPVFNSCGIFFVASRYLMVSEEP